jgi:EmrB/QacA subfamily drug resistance transporter
VKGSGSITMTHSSASSTMLDKHLIGVAIAVVLGSLLSTLDTTIVNVAITSLLRQFDTSLATIQWVATGYMLALATVIPLTGWASDRFGTKRLFMTSVALFIVGSALSGMAWSAASLVAFRFFQGFGGGMIVPVGMTILTHAAGPQRIGRVMGIVGIPMLLGPILGPILGGFFVDHLSWRWIFFINIPIGIIGLMVAARNLPSDEVKTHRVLDVVGLLLLSPGLAIFVYGLARLAAGGGEFSTNTIIFILIGLLLVLGFILYARNRNEALIDVRLFTRRTIGASAITTMLFGVVFFGLSFMMPLYLQVARGRSALEAGFLLAAQGFGAIFTMPIAGKLTDKTGSGKIVLVGLTLMAIGTLSLSRVTSTTPFWQLGLELFFTGLGAGAVMMPAMTGALGSLKPNEVARATSGLNVALRAGASIGTALFSVVLTGQIANLLPSMNGEKVNLSGLHIIPADAKALLQPKLSEAFGHTLIWSFAITLLTMVAAFLLPMRREPKLNESVEGDLE